MSTASIAKSTVIVMRMVSRIMMVMVVVTVRIVKCAVHTCVIIDASLSALLLPRCGHKTYTKQDYTNQYNKNVYNGDPHQTDLLSMTTV
jgi:hypothetical protein